MLQFPMKDTQVTTCCEREGRNKLPNTFNVFAIVQIMRFFPKETRSIKYSVYAFVPLFFMAEKNITPCRWPSWEKYNI